MFARFLTILALFHFAVAHVSASLVTCAPGYRGVDGVAQGIKHPVPLQPIDTTHLRETIRAGASTEAGVSVVVPVYRELASGNLARLLHGFTQQTAAGRNFELVCVVNNTPELTRDATFDNAITFRENQDTLKVLEYVRNPAAQEPEVFKTMDAAHVALFKQARDKGLRITVVDKSTAGTARNIGEIRNFGVDEVATRFPPGEKKRIVAMLDADTSVPHDYVENIMVHFATRPIDVLFLPMEYRVEPGAEDWVYRTSVANRREAAGTLFDRALHSNARHGGPQIVTTNEALKAIGGVPKFIRGEDSMLSEALARLRVGHGSDTRVLTADRARPDGYDSKKRHDESDSEYVVNDRPFFPTSLLVGRALLRLQSDRKMTESRLDHVFRSFDTPYSGKSFLERRNRMVEEAMLTTLGQSDATARLLADHGLPRLTRKEWAALELDASILFDRDGADTAKRMLILYVTAHGKQWNEQAWTKHLSKETFPDYFQGTSWQFQVLDSLKRDHHKPSGDAPWEIGLAQFLEKKLPSGEFAFYTAQTEKERDAHDQSVKNLTAVVMKRLDGRFPSPPGAESDPLVREFMQGNTWIGPWIAGRQAARKRPHEILVELREEYPDWFRPFAQTPFKKRLTETTVLTRMIREAEDHPERYPEMWNLLRTIRGE